jgi:L-fuconolactonase
MSTPFPIVDTHCHVISDDPFRFPPAPMGGKQSEWSRKPLTDAHMLQAMHEAGIVQSVLVQASTCYGHDNRYVADCVQRHPRQFAGVFSVDMTGADAVERISYWMDAGLSGVRVFIAGHTAADAGARLDDPRAAAAWQYLAERRIPVSVQLRAHLLGQLEAVLSRWPAAVVILDHCARPELDDGPPYARAQPLFALARYPNLFLKFTTHNVRESAQGKATQASFCRALVDRFGARRIAWGSNFPASPGGLKALLQQALEATSCLSSEEQEWIYSRTARTLYPALVADAGKGDLR